MLVLTAILLAFLPTLVMLYPFLRKRRIPVVLEDESSLQAELARRWESALEGLRNAELEWALGNLEEGDYQWLKQRYTTEAAAIMKAMELEQQEEEALLKRIEAEVEQVRQRVLGGVVSHSSDGKDSTGLADLQPRPAEDVRE